MRKKNIVIIAVSAALVSICLLTGMTAYGTYQWASRNHLQIGAFRVNDQSAEVHETQHFAATPGMTLEVDTGAGAISVSAADTNEIEVEMVKKA
jgi:hypothetical protein